MVFVLGIWSRLRTKTYQTLELYSTKNSFQNITITMTLRLSSQRDRTPKSLENKIQLPSSSSSSPFKLSSRWHFGRFYFRFHLAFTILFLIIISVIKVKRFRCSFCIGLFSGQRGSCPNMICWWLRVNRFFFLFLLFICLNSSKHDLLVNSFFL